MHVAAALSRWGLRGSQAGACVHVCWTSPCTALCILCMQVHAVHITGCSSCHATHHTLSAPGGASWALLSRQPACPAADIMECYEEHSTCLMSLRCHNQARVCPWLSNNVYLCACPPLASCLCACPQRMALRWMHAREAPPRLLPHPHMRAINSQQVSRGNE